MIKDLIFHFQVFTQLATGSGQDLTLQFDWIDGRYALNSTSP